MFRILAFVLALAPISAPLSAEQLVTAADTAKILEIARGFGSAELETDSDGAPVIRGRMDGRRYSVLFYGCENGADCTTVQFLTWMTAPADPLGTVNRWNRDFRFGKAHVDAEGDIVIEWDVNLWGGVSPRNLDDTFDWWRSVMARLDEVFGSPSVLPAPPERDPRGATL
jgi:hypothetical protein